MDQGGPSQSSQSTQLSHLRRSMNFTCNIHKPRNMAASHRRRCHPSLKISRDRFITRKRRLGRLWTLDPLPQPSECQHNNARRYHIHQRCFAAAASVLLFPRVPFLLPADAGEETQWCVPVFVVHTYSGMDLYPLGFAGTWVVWIVYIHNSDLEGQILKMQREATLAILCGMSDLRTVNLGPWEQENLSLPPRHLILSASPKGHHHSSSPPFTGEERVSRVISLCHENPWGRANALPCPVTKQFLLHCAPFS